MYFHHLKVTSGDFDVLLFLIGMVQLSCIQCFRQFEALSLHFVKIVDDSDYTLDVRDSGVLRLGHPSGKELEVVMAFLLISEVQQACNR
jgi:hypothetical protein